MSRAGVANKNKQYLQNRLKKMYGDDFDPIMRSAAHAVKMSSIAEVIDEDEEETNAVRLMTHKACVEAWDKIGQYVTPKLKATEVTGHLSVEEKTVQVNRKNFDGS